METGKWIKVDCFVDPELDEIMVSFSGPTGGVMHSLTNNLDAMRDIQTEKVMGFALHGFLKDIEAVEHGVKSDGAKLPCKNCGQPYGEHKGRCKFCKNRPTAYA